MVSVIRRVGAVPLARFAHSANKRYARVPSIPEEALQVAFSRASGPGGQNVNKRSTKVELRFSINDATWIPEDMRKELKEKMPQYQTLSGEFHLTSMKHRTQELNRKEVLKKLKDVLKDVCDIAEGRPTRGEEVAQKQMRNDAKKKQRARKNAALIKSFVAAKLSKEET